MGKSSYASNAFRLLKSRISAGGEIPESVIGECESFLSGVIVNGMNSYNTYYQAYCSYAVALGIEYVRNSGCTMYVSLDENYHKLSIDAVSVIDITESEYEVLFILAHEVKHLLFRHLLKYKYMFSDPVAHVFLNMATDVEVNESLKVDICGRFGKEADYRDKYLPKGCYDLSSACKTLRYSKKNLLDGYSRYKGTISSYLYKVYDNKCKKVLGYSISEILYRVKLDKNTSFKDEVFKVAEGGKSRIFNILPENSKEARRFCEDISRYLDNTPTSVVYVEVTDKDIYSYVKDVLDNVGEFQECIMSKTFMSEKGRSANGEGDSKEIDMEEAKPILPWQSMLKKYMNTTSTLKEPSKRRINRRNPNRLELSGKKRKKLLRLVIAVDDSGSFSDEECGYAMSEIASIVSHVECEVVLYRFASKVELCEVYSYRKARKELGVLKPKLRRFRGGTSYQPVFDAINEDKKFRPSDCVVIILTDGYGESKVDFGKVNKRIWVVTGGKKEISCSENPDNIFPVVLT